MKKIAIAIFTTSRAEFGILLPFIKELHNDKYFDYYLFVGGSHLAKENGYTINEIRNSNVKIAATFDYLLNEDTALSIVRSMGIATIELASIFNSYVFDWVCILGDRYELLTIASVAILFKKPIIHISGGEYTEGALDNQIRHMLTKASHLHFTYSDEYVENILKMGEEPWRIFNTGALGVDNLINYPSITKNALFRKLELKLNRSTALLTYHPVSLEFSTSVMDQLENIFSAIRSFNIQLVITSPNADENRETIVEYLLKMVKENSNYYFFNSLGEYDYSNLIPYCDFVIGNSSSGITYVPYFKVPTINIGNRQKGRIRHDSIVDTDYSVNNIRKAIKLVLSSEFQDKIKTMNYKFGLGDSALRMKDIIKGTPIDKKLLVKEMVVSKE